MGTLKGRIAEERAVRYLEQAGLAILAQNWRNRWCEIDVVAKSRSSVHIVEVKYRARSQWGTAADYVTPQKLERLRRAALAWAQAHSYNGPIQVDVVAIDGIGDAVKVDWIPNVIED